MNLSEATASKESDFSKKTNVSQVFLTRNYCKAWEISFKNKGCQLPNPLDNSPIKDTECANFKHEIQTSF
jgi:hypothetical protein